MGRKREYLFGDLYNIGERVKEIDPLLRISFDRRKFKYSVTRGKHQVMTVDAGELDVRVLRKLREHDLHRRRLQDFIYELEQSEDEFERRKARELSNQIESITLDNYDRIVGIPHYNLGGVN
ncbi:MAG: hypothetical protein PHW65_05615 [Dehalococcoidales bacterium]|nr:hypothetical protein [Dehalococcoidales bacterium]